MVVEKIVEARRGFETFHGRGCWAGMIGLLNGSSRKSKLWSSWGQRLLVENGIDPPDRRWWVAHIQLATRLVIC